MRSGTASLLAAAGVLCAATVHAASPPEMVMPTVGVPLSAGSRTTLRFVVRNIGQNPVTVSAPFSGRTHLLVTLPGGQTRDITRKAGRAAAETLNPGHARAWDVDLSDWVEFAKGGQYMIWFRANDSESNRIILIKD